MDQKQLKIKRRKKSLKWAKQRVSSCFQSKVTKASFDALEIKEGTANEVKHMIKISGVVFWKNSKKTEAIWSNFKFFIDELHLHTFVCRLQPPEVDFACSPRVKLYIKTIFGRIRWRLISIELSQLEASAIIWENNVFLTIISLKFLFFV